MNNSIPVIVCRFVLFSEEVFDPNEITNLVEIAPTSTAIKGVTRKRYGKGTLGETCWEIRKKCRTHYIDEAICEVLDFVWPRREKILECVRSMHLSSKLFCVIESDFREIGFWFGRDLIKRLAEMNLELDLDVYGD